MRFLLLILRCVLAFHGSHPSLNRTQHDCYEVVSQKYSSENAPSDSLREASTNAPYVAHDRLGENVAEPSKIQKELATVATLIPKLRVHFAEFLNEGSPAHLRILSPHTCALR